jgi:FkbM family methyltransferase
MNTENYRDLSFGEQVLAAFLKYIPIRHGKHRFLDLFFPASWNPGIKTVRINFFGAQLFIDVNDLVGWHFAIVKSFDPEVVEVLHASIDGNGGVLWDIGANKGACSYPLAMMNKKLSIVAIEPQQALRANTERNLKMLAAGRFEYFAVGIGEIEETLDLKIPASNIGKASLHLSASDSTGARTESIHILTASQIAQKSVFGWPDFIKIDVEGHEQYVIESLRTVFEARKCKVMVFENHPHEVAAFEKICQIANAYGYEIYSIQKTLFTTKLVQVTEVRSASTDYVMVLDSFLQNCTALRRLCSSVP